MSKIVTRKYTQGAHFNIEEPRVRVTIEMPLFAARLLRRWSRYQAWSMGDIIAMMLIAFCKFKVPGVSGKLKFRRKGSMAFCATKLTVMFMKFRERQQVKRDLRAVRRSLEGGAS